MGGCCSKEEIGGLLEGKEKGGEEDGARLGEGRARVRLKGSCRFASMFTQQGWKGVNQDAMTIWEDFAGAKGQIFCGVFDGHGPFGHRVAWHVRDVLPSKLSSKVNSLRYRDDKNVLSDNYDGEDDDDDDNNDNDNNFCRLFSSLEASFVKAFEELDKELGRHSSIDCICSGTTSVSIVKQREHLIIANLGDSRAILCTRDAEDQLIPIQLTVDLKPNLPSEEERIRGCRGRVFALEEEPEVSRMWLPDEDCPGLAMARAFGDFCLKDFGLISTPQVSYRKLSDRDEFVVLATDGVWDVLSNDEVVKIVSSASKRSDTAKNLVGRAVRAWKRKHPISKIDDCAVICLFLKPPCDPRNIGVKSVESSLSESFKTARSEEASEPDQKKVVVGSKEEWTALESVSRANSLLKLPRFASALSWRKRSVKINEDED